MSNNLRSLEIIGYVQQAEHLTSFLCLVEKDVANKNEDIVMQIVDCYSKNVQLDREYETNEVELVPTLIKGKQVLKAIWVLQLYEKQQVFGEGSVLCELGQLKRIILEQEMVLKKININYTMVFLVLLCAPLYNKFLFITKSIAIILYFVITRFDCSSI